MNNDLIATSNQDVAVDILSEYKAKILSQKEMCSELVKSVPYFREKLAQSEKQYSFTLKKVDSTLKKVIGFGENIDEKKKNMKLISCKSLELEAELLELYTELEGKGIEIRETIVIEEGITIADVRKKVDEAKERVDEIKKAIDAEEKWRAVEKETKRLLSETNLQRGCLAKFNNNPTIERLYEPDIVAHLNDSSKCLNSGHFSTLSKVSRELLGSREPDKQKLFSFIENNGNYVSKDGSDLSWTKGDDLYHVESRLEKVEVAMRKVSLKQSQI